AVKIPTNAEFIDNLRREGALLHALRGEHIVAIKGLDPYADPPYLTMEYVPGKSLRQVLEERKNLPLDDAVEIYRQALMGLRTAHRQGVIHRDVKPENVMIDPEGVVKLTDFGLGRAVEATASVALQSGALRTVGEGGVTGTLRYMSPEQREGGPVDARTDLYSLGIVFFEMLVGEPPQGAELPSDLEEKLPVWVDKIFSRCYTRLEKRYANAAEALEHLEALLPRPRKTDIVYLGEVKVSPPPPPRAVPASPFDEGPRPLWMLPFFGLHALFEGVGNGAQKVVRGLRDGGGAGVLAFVFAFLLAAGAVVLLIGRLPSASKNPRSHPAIPQVQGSEGVERALGDLEHAYARGDWKGVWRRLSTRAREQIAEIPGYEPMDHSWSRDDHRILENLMKGWPSNDPPGVLEVYHRVRKAKVSRIEKTRDGRFRTVAGGEALYWKWDQFGGWKLDVPPRKERGSQGQTRRYGVRKW
ncbi:MAG: serine/threonine-protein kinase, partial [Planctomycetota bacterium]